MIDKIIELPMFLANNITGGLFIAIILIIFARFFFKKKIDTIITLEIIRWTIIISSFITLISWLLVLILPSFKKYIFLNISNGLFTWLYWFLFIINAIIPLILLNRKIGKEIYIILLLTLFMNMGWVFECFLMLKSTYYMSYFKGNYLDFYFDGRQIPTLIKGFFVGLVSLFIGNGIKKFNSHKEN